MGGSLDKIIVKGAREHNLKNVSLEIPKNKFVVFTGVSGSGKSSLAMDTIYAEGQRRYVESLSSYARQFLGIMSKPDVDSIEGLSPAIAIDQKTTSRNPRSTVGTATEVYDFLRLLYARIGHPHCAKCGREVSRQSIQQIVNGIIDIVKNQKEFRSERGVRFMLMSPVVRDRKGEYSALFENLKKQGIVRARVDGEVYDLREHIELIKTNKHSIDAILSRYVVNNKKYKDKQGAKSFESALHQTVELSAKLSDGHVVLGVVKDKSFDFSQSPKEFENHMFSENFSCPVCNISIQDLEPRMFSFNSPHGACSECDGLGARLAVDEELVVNLDLSVRGGGIIPWQKLFENHSWTSKVVESVAKKYDFSLDVPIGKLPKRVEDILLYGAKEEERFKVGYFKDGNTNTYFARFEGVIRNLARRHRETKSDFIRREIERYMVKEACPKCLGARLSESSLSVVVDGKNIYEISNLSIDKVAKWCNELSSKSNEREKKILELIIKEMMYRLNFLIDVGLSYLTLGRASGDLSGGEAQRIRLASQIGSGLSGVLYVLDEPSVGLHQKDQKKLINTLKHLRDLGNTVLVVEHDMETIFESDYIFDFGPGAGGHGGEIVSCGTPAQISRDLNSLTGKYLSGKLKVGDGVANDTHPEDFDRKIKYNGEYLVLKGAEGRNLKNIDLNIPLGKFVCVTGVSGSGKSSLVMDTLYVALRQEYGLKIYKRPEKHESVTGVEHIDKVIAIDQSPIGRTPKSNPATYTKVFDHIRDLYSRTEGARIRGYKLGRFSFNVRGGRCEACSGGGQIRIEMQFMPDVYVKCDVCKGKRYNREALEVVYKGKNISEVLNMTVEEALEFFAGIPPIKRRLQTIYDVGLGYIKLGQPAPTLSGGEAQRVKLASELSKKTSGKALYILDEPTTGLHFYDLERLISIIKRLTAKGNTVVIIEHNMDVVANSDWVIDLGPEGGDAGGDIVFSGCLDDLLKSKSSHTAKSLREHLQRY